MNKKNILLGAFSIAIFSFTACNKDNDYLNEDGTVNIEKAIEFNVDFADYNEDQEVGVTRVSNKEEKLQQQMVDLGNGVLAQCTLQRDTTKRPKSTTRAIPYGTYTMLAYDVSDNSLKGEITGIVNGSIFTPSYKNSKSIRLIPGKTYDFVLFNNFVIRNGNQLKVTRDNNTDRALIARTRKTISSTPYDQKISFTLKRAASKVRIKISSYESLEHAAITTKFYLDDETGLPGSSIYDASIGEWGMGDDRTSALSLQYIPYSFGGTETDSWKYYTMNKNGDHNTADIIFTPGIDVSKLKLTFTNARFYGQPIANNITFKFNPSQTLKFEENGSYILNVDLKYNFVYLMSNGEVLPLKDIPNNDGTKKPIAIVISKSRRMAVALKDLYGPNVTTRWWMDNRKNVQTNTHYYDITRFVGSTYMEFNEVNTSGRDETWDPGFSTGNVIGDKVKGRNPDFPAFKAAAEYNPGIAYTGGQSLVWYLPSISDWKIAVAVLGKVNQELKLFNAEYNFNKGFANTAFAQVGYRPLFMNTFNIFYTSTEVRNTKAYSYPLLFLGSAIGFKYDNKFYLGTAYKDGSNAQHQILPFVAY